MELLQLINDLNNGADESKLQVGLDIRTSCNGYILFAWPGLRTYVELVLISITNCINRAFLLHVL